MDTYVEQTCITFEERTNQEDYVRFFSGEGYVKSQYDAPVVIESFSIHTVATHTLGE